MKFQQAPEAFAFGVFMDAEQEKTAEIW